MDEHQYNLILGIFVSLSLVIMTVASVHVSLIITLVLSVITYLVIRKTIDIYNSLK